MKLSLTLLGLCTSSHALHNRRSTRTTDSQQLRRTVRDTVSDSLIEASSTDSPYPTKPKKPLPWWKLPNTENGEMNAISWTQYYPLNNDGESHSEEIGTGVSVGNNVCPINQCQSSGVLGQFYCGQNARCLQNYCQCNLGWKPANNVPVSRGWTGLEALTVWVEDYSSGCTERCNSLSCSEVPQVKGCFDQHVRHTYNDEGSGQAQGGLEGLATDVLHLGAIKAPGADGGIGR
ncbi:uncharacterized protein M421DRAFT_364883 [Didymella exigua CBS 183.55]|uniref:Uncharacterized protein n=1 Tax=Didymella exigua CBS 183.55 TaxID=1150837 RepID=A0A6A5RV54_9PLEO|nr:uncharacterized protein M421DRAFT_364883 [Didymella exigua CBS 183.55]KAF1931044.1 hypothetical protein M421DRAFT_364883 [Didymella exigua CBS 183.55]